MTKRKLAPYVIICLFRKIFSNLHSLHSQVVPGSMDKRVLDYDVTIHFLEKFMDVLKSDQAAELDSEQRLEQLPDCFMRNTFRF